MLQYSIYQSAQQHLSLEHCFLLVAVSSLGFCGAAWLVFTSYLQVPLRKCLLTQGSLPRQTHYHLYVTCSQVSLSRVTFYSERQNYNLSAYLISQSHLNFNMSQVHYLPESGPLGILCLGESHYYPLSYASQKLSNWGIILPVSPWMFRIHVYLHMYLLTPCTSLHPCWHHHFLPGSLTATQHTLLLFPL